MPFRRIPSVFPISRSLIISDGLMYSGMKDGSHKPLHVFRHGIRGTQNQIMAGAEVSNVQMTDSAKLDPSSSVLVVKFSLKPLDLSASASLIAGAEDGYIQAYKEFLRRSNNSNGQAEVSRRMAHNIANARFGWRNRLSSTNINVSVRLGGSNNEVVVFKDATLLPYNDFDPVDGVRTIGNWINEGFRGNSNVIHVEAHFEFGVEGCEVYPSQNYFDKKRGFARPLYCVGDAPRTGQEDRDTTVRIMGQAALRDQKIWNAIRTIDTWYDDYTDGSPAIPIEPMGAYLSDNTFHRRENNGFGTALFDYLRRIDELDPNSEEGMFTTACLIRGGVFNDAKESPDHKAAKKELEKAAKAAAKSKEASATSDLLI